MCKRQKVKAIAFVIALFVAPGNNVWAARHLQVEIFIDKTLVLSGGAGDSGTPDADAVWRNLPSIELTPTIDFVKKYGLKVDRGQVVLNGDPVKLSIQYGGMAEVKKLRLLQRAAPDGTVVWIVDPADVKRYFRIRYIYRDEVVRLVNSAAQE